MKNRILLTLAVILTGLALACAPSSANKSSHDKNLTLRIPLVTWGGYAALFAANGGAAPTEDSLFYKYGHFKVELIQEENPANQLQGFANGTYQIIWSTMDMLPLTYDSLSKDPKSSPKVLGLFDWSAGGDGIIVRGNIKTPAELKGKKIVTAQYTPSHFFILYILKQAGLTQKDVSMVYAADAIAAKDTFINDKTVDACVTWSPFIYDITDSKKETYVKGSSLLTTSAPGNPVYGLIADVYLARADLLKDHPEVAPAFTKAMIEGYDLFLANKEKTAGQIADLFGIKGGATEVMAMIGDVTVAGKAENKRFFTPEDPVSAVNIFKLSAELYKGADEQTKNLGADPNLVLAPEYMLKAIE